MVVVIIWSYCEKIKFLLTEFSLKLEDLEDTSITIQVLDFSLVTARTTETYVLKVLVFTLLDVSAIPFQSLINCFEDGHYDKIAQL